MKSNRASATATLIAAATVMSTADPRPGVAVPPEAGALCRAFLQDTRATRLLAASAQSPLAWPLWRTLERLTHPGIVAHWALRKQRIEACCRAALTRGVRRVVIVGAGLDTLALRLAPSCPDVMWVEVDHPATQAAKRRGVERVFGTAAEGPSVATAERTSVAPAERPHLDSAERPRVDSAERPRVDSAERPRVDSAAQPQATTHLPPHRPPHRPAHSPPHFVPADLALDATWVQRVPPIDGGSTLVILEGVLMYLSPPRVEALLRDELMRLRGPHGDALHLVFSYMARDASGRGGFTPSSRLVQWWLRHRQEPFDWMVKPREVAPWLQGLGYAVASHRRPPFDDDHALDGAGAGLQGENLVEAFAISS